MSMCFVGLERGRPCPSGYADGVLHQYGAGGHVLRAARSLEQELGSPGWQEVRPGSGACWTPAGLPFVTHSVHNFYRQNL